MVDGLALFGIGASWGGFESLVLPYDCGGLPQRPPASSRAGRGLRFHIGLEDLDDLKADLDSGFARYRATA